MSKVGKRRIFTGRSSRRQGYGLAGGKNGKKIIATFQEENKPRMDAN